MKNFFRLTAVFLLLSGALQGAPLEESYRFNDHGRVREFEIARDEVQRSRVPVPIAPRANADGVRAAARLAGGDLIVYEKGKPHTALTRRLVTSRLAVQLAPGLDSGVLGRAAGAESVSAAAANAGWYVFQAAADPGSSLQMAAKLRRIPGVLAVEPLLARQQEKRFIPNDPFFDKQWHLRNTGQLGGPAGIDLNITGVWDTYQGDGMTIGIVDDGLEHTHPDIAPNYAPALSFDFNFNQSDPQPAAYDGDDHGTACAGLAAAAGNNGIGVTGAAFKAKLAGIRLIALPSTDEQEAAAFALHNDLIAIKSNSWGADDDGKTLEGPGPLATAALEDGVQNGRGGKGTIYVWAGGNGGLVGDAATFDGYVGNRGVIAVGRGHKHGSESALLRAGDGSALRRAIERWCGESRHHHGGSCR